jgi:hypothetical protein
VALAAFPRQQVAGLQGEAWLVFLDGDSKEKLFSSGIGRVLITGPYQATLDLTIDALFPLIQSWIKKRL